MSEDSDIEILGVSENILNGIKNNKFNTTAKKWKRTDSENDFKKRSPISSVCEEIIISDTSDASDNDNSQIEKSSKKQTYLDFNSKRQFPNKNESLSSIILNCPRCNKTETVFSTTIKCICKECKVNMSYVCNECNYRYESMFALYRHKKFQCQSNSKNRKLLKPLKLVIRKCSKCGLSQKERQILKSKRCLKCKIDMTYECSICSKTYGSYSGLYTHIKLQCQPNTKTYYCNNCSYKTTNQAFLTRHLNKYHTESQKVKIKCVKCEKTFDDTVCLKMHEFHCGMSHYQCKFCSCKPKFQENLRKHLITRHKDCIQEKDLDSIVLEIVNAKGNEIKTVNSKNAEEYDITHLKKVYCSNCNMSWQFFPGFRNCNQCKTQYLYECGRCNKMFKKPALLYRHIRRQHGKLIYCCSHCGRSFSFYGDANEHRKSCGTNPRYECTICFFKTRYKYNLRCHMNKLHNENRRCYTCNLCGISYKTKKSINKHQETVCISKVAIQ